MSLRQNKNKKSQSDHTTAIILLFRSVNRQIIAITLYQLFFCICKGKIFQNSRCWLHVASEKASIYYYTYFCPINGKDE